MELRTCSAPACPGAAPACGADANVLFGEKGRNESQRRSCELTFFFLSLLRELFPFLPPAMAPIRNKRGHVSEFNKGVAAIVDLPRATRSGRKIGSVVVEAVEPVVEPVVDVVVPVVEAVVDVPVVDVPVVVAVVPENVIVVAEWDGVDSDAEESAEESEALDDYLEVNEVGHYYYLHPQHPTHSQDPSRAASSASDAPDWANYPLAAAAADEENVPDCDCGCTVTGEEEVTPTQLFVDLALSDGEVEAEAAFIPEVYDDDVFVTNVVVAPLP